MGRNFFNETRFQWRNQTNGAVVVHRRPTLQVLDAFTAGGAQIEGGRNGTDIELATDFDYATRPALGARRLPARSGALSQRRQPQHGRHVHVRQPGGLRGGTSDHLHAAQRQSARASTRRCSSAVTSRTTCGWRAACRSAPASATRRRRTPDDYLNFAPRVGATWSPFKSGKTTFRGGARHLLRVVRRADLRADAARRRHSSDRPRHPEPWVSRSVRTAATSSCCRRAGTCRPRT